MCIGWVRGGYLETIRGKNGGFRLGRDAKDINIGELIRYTEDELNIVKCLDGNDAICFGQNKCHFACVIKESLDAFLATLDKYTLKDIVDEDMTMNG